MLAFLEILRPQIVVPLDAAGTISVKEDDPSAVLRKLDITGVPMGSVAFELDHSPNSLLKRKFGNAFKQLSCLINDEHQMANKSCDLVIVFRSGDSVDVILGDLKSTSPKKGDCVAQLRNSELFVRYLSTLVDAYHERVTIGRVIKAIFFVGPGINAKVPTQQKNKQDPFVHEGVVFFPLTVAGRNNGNASIAFSRLL